LLYFNLDFAKNWAHLGKGNVPSQDYWNCGAEKVFIADGCAGVNQSGRGEIASMPLLDAAESSSG
jgi:hypothetical protein